MTTPWKLTGMGRLVDATGNPITLPPLDGGSTQSDWIALEMVVLRVNSHDRLVKALTDANALMATAAHYVSNESVRTTNKFDRTQTVEVCGLRDALKSAADDSRAALAALKP